MTDPEPELTILDEIRNALLEVDTNVYYGTAAKHPAGSAWNYIVFARDSVDVTATNITENFKISVVREDYVEPDMLADVLNALADIKFLRFEVGKPVDFLQEVKPNTDRTIEVMVFSFAHAMRR